MSLYLEYAFRNWFFCKLYFNSNESLNDIARNLGYSGKGRHGQIRNMWIGKISIPSKKLGQFCDLANISMEEVLKHKILQNDVKKTKDWNDIVFLFKNSKNPSLETFLN